MSVILPCQAWNVISLTLSVQWSALRMSQVSGVLHSNAIANTLAIPHAMVKPRRKLHSQMCLLTLVRREMRQTMVHFEAAKATRYRTRDA